VTGQGDNAFVCFHFRSHVFAFVTKGFGTRELEFGAQAQAQRKFVSEKFRNRNLLKARAVRITSGHSETGGKSGDSG
jgi:hypothetical protein